MSEETKMVEEATNKENEKQVKKNNQDRFKNKEEKRTEALKYCPFKNLLKK